MDETEATVVLVAGVDAHGHATILVVRDDEPNVDVTAWRDSLREGDNVMTRAAQVIAIIAGQKRRGFEFGECRERLSRAWGVDENSYGKTIARRIQKAITRGGAVALEDRGDGMLAPFILQAYVHCEIAPDAVELYAPLFDDDTDRSGAALDRPSVAHSSAAPAARSAAPVDPRMPPVPSLFVGRTADVETLLDRLEKAAQARAPELRVQMVAALKGMAGVGKTSLAVHLASRPEISRWFPGGVLWAHTGSSPQVAADLSHWGALLEDPSVRSEPSTMRLAERVAALADASPVLAIVDDVQSVDDVVMFETAIGRRSVLLATTRRPLLASQIARRAEQVHEVRTLGLDDAHVLLEAIAPAVRATSRAIRTRLLRQLGGLPIAIHVAGRLLASEAESGLDVERLAAELASAKPPLRWMLALEAPHEMYVGSLDPLRSTTPKIRTLLERSLACLSEDARRHFALMGGLPDESRVPAAVLADLWETDDPRATIRELVASGLLDVAGPDQFSLHSLINAFASLLLHGGQHDTTPAARRRSRARRDRPTG